MLHDSPGSPRPNGVLRAAVTLEQCWHEVPGGTAVAALETLRAMQSLAGTVPLQLVGVSARHSAPPPEPWQPPVPVRQLALPRVLLYEAWHRARWPAVQKATGPVDVIWATGYAVPPRSAPIVLTIHDLAFRRDRSHFTRHGVRFFEAALRRAREAADIVLCSSEATRADCLEAGFPPGRLRVVPLGVRYFDLGDAHDAAGAVTEAREAFGLRRPYVVTLGTVEPRKNLRVLLAAFAELRSAGHDLDLVVVGPGGWGDDLNGAVAALGPHVHFTGFVDERTKAALLRGAEVMAYPSLWEGFGLPVLEAMVQGTPVVTSAGIATEEVAGDAAVLVDPHDERALAHAIASVIDSPPTSARLRAAGTARAKAFTWERTARQVLAALADAAGKTAEPGSR